MNAHELGVSDLSILRTGAGVTAARLPDNARVLTDIDSALKNGVQAVVIANPTSLHIDSALAAAKAGRHLFIEKPLSHTLAGIEELQSQVYRQHLVAMVGYQFRFHPSLRQVRSWLQEKAIGEIVSARVAWGEYLPAWQPWRDYRTSYSARSDLGGGVVLTLSHPVDYLRWLIGEVKCVTAIVSRRSGLDLDVEDTALLSLEFENGALGSVSLDYAQRPQQHDMVIVGRDGVIRWDNASGIATLELPDQRTTATVPEDFERNHMFIAEMNHFLDCIAGKKEPACSVSEGERTLRVCLAALESARSGQKVHV